MVDEEAAVTDHVFLSAALEEPLSLEPWIEVPKMPQPVGEGEKDDVKVTVFSAQLLSDGGLKLELMVDNGSDEPLDFDTYHAGLMINGNPLRGMSWYLLESDGSKDSFLTFQPHSARYACIILGGSSQYGGPVYRIG